MTPPRFNRDEKARWYARRHLETDPGTRVIYYLPEEAPEREIRLLEVNELMPPRDLAPLEPIDFGVDYGAADAHTLMVLDVTPAQWEKIDKREVLLPAGWSLENAIPFPRQRA